MNRLEFRGGAGPADLQKVNYYYYANYQIDAGKGSPTQYTVQDSGETLQSIARQVYGDARLWYLIAEANAIANEYGLG